jgi:hypothetical protein
MITALGCTFELELQLFQAGNGGGVAAFHGPGSELAGEQRLACEQIPDIVTGQRDDDEAAPGLQPDETLSAQSQQALTHGRGADSQLLRDGLRADKIPALQLAGHNQITNEGRRLGS